MMMYDYSGQGVRGGIGNDVMGFVFMLLMMSLVILGIIFALRYFSRTSSHRQVTGTAVDLLEKRYAQGEIDTKEFEEKRKVLGD